MKKISIIGLDIAKKTFEACGQDEKGKTVEKRKLNRGQVLAWFAQQAPCVIGLEACGGAHYWARELKKRGHDVRILPPQYVKPYVVRNKSDRHDARAIARALRDPEIPCVAIASPEQQDIQVLHRVRARVIRERTALVNQMRGFLLEYGIAIPKNIEKARHEFRRIMEDPPEALSLGFGEVMEDHMRELHQKDEKIDRYTKKIESHAQSDPAGIRVKKVLGIGWLTASALLLKVRHESVYRNGRHFSASLGLVPRTEGTGGMIRIKGMSKRGDRYLRSLLIHGARAVVMHAAHKKDPLSLWVKGLLERRGHNKTVVALANKNARIAWAVIAKEVEYDIRWAVNWPKAA